MPRTYEPIASTTLGSAASSITLSSIPATFTDLRLVVVASASVSGSNVNLRVNGDTATNYSATQLEGSFATGSTRQSNFAQINGYWQVGTDANVSTYIADFMSYANTNVNKTVLYSGGNGGEVFRVVGLWRSTSAINSVTILISGGNFNSGATASLYGIKAA